MAHAARLDSVESVISLLRLGIPITSAIISVSSGSSMSNFLIEELVKRRQYLRDLAFEVLPPEDVKQLGLLPWTLPDISLLPLCSLFSQHGFKIRSYHHGVTHVQSVFHAPALSPRHMEGLWGAGFREIDVPDQFGHTPLVAWNVGSPLQASLSRAEWLIDHGADVQKVISSNSTSVCHHICLNLMHKFTAMCYEKRRLSKLLGEALDEVYKSIHDLHDSSRLLVGSSFRSPVTDHCICHCSTGGCTPLAVALRHVRGTIELLSTREDIREESYMHDLVKGVYEIILLNAINHGGSPAQVVRSVLRLITFDALGLTHTCCREDSTLNLQPFSRVDADEIHDEERLLSDNFEVLLNAYERQYKTLGIPLWDFIESHWSVQMTKHLQSKGEAIDPGSLCVILALGVCNEATLVPHSNPISPEIAGELGQGTMALIGAELIAKASLELLGRVNNLAATKEFELVTEFLIYLAASLTSQPYAESSIQGLIVGEPNELYVDWMYSARGRSLGVVVSPIPRSSATVGLFLVRTFLETLLERLFRSHNPRGSGRLTWTCQHCQRTFTETVREMFPGAATDWVHQLNQAQISNSGSTSVVTPKPTLLAQFSQAITMLFRKVFRAGGKSHNITTPHALPQSGNTAQTRAADAKYLLLAIPSYRRKDRLVHLDIQNTTTDEQLYRSMGHVYNAARKHWKWIRLRSLSHIEWKQFYIYHSDKIALNCKAEEDWPQCGRASCETGCKLAVDYEYSPRPAHVDPPIPRQALMHFLENPDHAGSKLFHRDTVPKRDNFLSLGPNDHLREGWCLAFIETLSWARIAAIEGIIGVGSLIFAIGWTETHGSGSISDAFAPSCWMLALGAIILTLMYHHEQ
ncbi:hypothetical protein BJX68DRAFT_272173 [Aspergillus pseudodeflectus]|uniref:Ankyrin repeat-containing domain protein n=1 Tax=Aspergillus pseudodeflectus TaxID=176178 RepID=A0ABR4JGZ6_9EURO